MTTYTITITDDIDALLVTCLGGKVSEFIEQQLLDIAKGQEQRDILKSSPTVVTASKLSVSSVVVK